MASLQEFWNDKETCENVKKFLDQVLVDEAVRRVFAKEEVGAIADAREVIEKAFAILDETFQKKVDKRAINEAK